CLIPDLVRDLAPRIVGDSPTDRRAPQPRVDRVLAKARIDIDAALPEEGVLLLAAQSLVANRRDHLDLGAEDLERDVEAHLVVSCSGRAVSDRRRADLLRDL